ncbi:phage tail family protein [Siminovitchia terrae]|uniref:Phage tail family protein n=1 Tax=Siminovitchia terrae TaxID=1914933 RepID=A0A429X8L4_SIMTE|nr:distal tail protein Dit [Siminovitchia terrae]RST59716.1 phage tail family protein [Siminovitchia terrae]
MSKKSFSFNGIRKPWLHMTRGRNKPLFVPIQRNILKVPGMAGAYLQSSEIQPMEFEQPIAFIAKNDVHALQLKDELAAWLITDTPAPLEFDDEPGRTYYALVQNTIEDFERIAILRQGTIQFLCLDPYGYGPEKILTFPTDAVKIDNKGTAEADPIFELTAKKKTTFAMISNGDEVYNLVGKPADVDEQLVNEKTLIFDERGDTLSSWTSAGTAIDHMGKVTGKLVPDGTGIVVESYGTPDKDQWHGPALMKEITPVQDFEIEMRCRAETTNPKQTYRIEFYLYDEHMNVLGKMAIWDSSDKRIQYAAEGRYGPFLGSRIHYPIYSANYLKLEKHFHGMVRMRRIGKRFEFYVARLTSGAGSSGKHYDTLTKVYNDVANEYQGKLKYVQIHIGKYRGTSNANLPRINAIKAYKHTTATVDQTPYIMDAGDVLTLDHKTKDILLNGESRKDLKNFGGSFFKLKKGENMLLVSPEDTFDTRAIFQERFL